MKKTFALKALIAVAAITSAATYAVELNPYRDYVVESGDSERGMVIVDDEGFGTETLWNNLARYAPSLFGQKLAVKRVTLTSRKDAFEAAVTAARPDFVDAAAQFLTNEVQFGGDALGKLETQLRLARIQNQGRLAKLTATATALALGSRLKGATRSTFEFFGIVEKAKKPSEVEAQTAVLSQNLDTLTAAVNKTTEAVLQTRSYSKVVKRDEPPVAGPSSAAPQPPVTPKVQGQPGYVATIVDHINAGAGSIADKTGLTWVAHKTKLDVAGNKVKGFTANATTFVSDKATTAVNAVFNNKAAVGAGALAAIEINKYRDYLTRMVKVVERIRANGQAFGIKATDATLQARLAKIEAELQEDLAFWSKLDVVGAAAGNKTTAERVEQLRSKVASVLEATKTAPKAAQALLTPARVILRDAAN